MTTIVLTQRAKGSNSDQSTLHDKALEAGSIVIDQNGYTAGLDRVYDVKGLKNMHVRINNDDGADGLIFKIERTEKEFSDISTLADGDFDKDILGDTTVAFGTSSINDVIDISPESTAIRIRVKREVAGNDAELSGFVSVN